MADTADFNRLLQRGARQRAMELLNAEPDGTRLGAKLVEIDSSNVMMLGFWELFSEIVEQLRITNQHLAILTGENVEIEI